MHIFINDSLKHIEDLTIDDISKVDFCSSLAKISRFGGLLPLMTHYSVAEHSVICSTIANELYDKESGYDLLYHDFHEAFVGDIIWPVKNVPGIKKHLNEITDHLDKLIEEYFQVNLKNPKINDIDKFVGYKEIAHFFPNIDIPYSCNLDYDKPLNFRCLEKIGSRGLLQSHMISHAKNKI